MALTITSHPKSQTIEEGKTVTFRVSFSVDSPFGGFTTTYQWYKNGSKISNANKSSLTYGPTVLSDNNSTFYCVIIAETHGSATSNKAILTVTQSQTSTNDGSPFSGGGTNTNTDDGTDPSSPFGGGGTNTNTDNGIDPSSPSDDEDSSDDNSQGNDFGIDTSDRPDWPPCTSAVPPATILASEFYNLQDLDGNGLIYGYDFKITDDFEHTPPWKPIILINIEQSPYWSSPVEEMDWLSFLQSLGYTSNQDSGGGGGGSVTGGYKIEKLVEISGYLWLLSYVNNKLYSGSYNQDGSQYYYSANSPFSSFSKNVVSGSDGHESTRVYNLNNNLYVTTEGLQGGSSSSGNGALVLPNGSKTTGFDKQFSLSAVYFNGSYLIGWCKQNSDYTSQTEGTYLYDCPPTGGKTLKKHITSVMAFSAVVYRDKLYLLGCKRDKSYRTTSGAGILVEVDSSYNFKTIHEPSDAGVGCWLEVFDDKLFCMYSNNTVVYSYDGSSFKSELNVGSSFKLGGACVFNNKLILPLVGSTAEIRARSTDSDGGSWSTIVTNDTLTSLGGQPQASDLIAPTGFCASTSNSAFISITLNSGRSGPSAIYKLTVDTSTNEDVPFKLSDVVWLDTDVSGWSETAKLSSVSISGSTISLPFDKTNTWSTVYYDGADMNANPWIFIEKDGKWYASTWEWFKKGSYSKSTSAVAGDHMKKSEFSDSWKPTSGVRYGFMVSGLARLDKRNVSERSNIIMITWP